jgi:hypothetical protein
MAITVKHSKVSTIPDDADTSLVRPSDWNADHTLTGTIPIANGGTGQSTANDGFNALAPSQTGNSGKYLTTNGTDSSWSVNPLGTVTSVAATAGTGISVTGSPITTSGTLNITNTAPDQTVSIASGTGISATGTYPAFTVTNTLPDLTVALTGAGTTTVTGTYPNFTITSADSKVGDVVGPASATDNAVARFDTATGKLIQNSVTLIDDTGNASGILSQQFSNGSAVTLAAGKMWYDGTTGAWNAGMGGGNITQQIGEELFVYGKASTAITDSPLQIIYQTGVVGASGAITFAPTISGITDGTLILGVATENITLNNFGRATSYGVVRGITTNGTAFSETWADGDEIYYNPVTGNPTNIKPVAPYIKVSVGTIIKAGSGGSGSIQVEINHGSVLGGTDANVQITSVSNGQILSYDGGNGYWKNTDLTAGTGISISESVNGVLTVTNTSPSSGGTVTSVTGTSPVVSSGGNTPAISMPAATTSVSGYLTSTDWTTFNNKSNTNGTVTSVAAITLGTTGTDLSSTVANGTTTPVITLQVPTASAANRGALSAADWTTFNNKGSVTAVSVVSANGFTGTSSGGATPALTLTTSITGMLKGNGAAISAGTAGTDFVAPATATSFTAQQYFGNVALTDAATIAWAANTAQVATFTFVSSNRTMGAPTGLVSGAYYGLAVIQNGGSNTLTWNSVFKWAGGTAPTLSTAASAKDYFVFRTDGTNLYEQGRSLGVA